MHAQKFLNHCLRHGYAPGLGAPEPRFMDRQAGWRIARRKKRIRSRCARNVGSRFLFSAVSLVPLSRRFGFRHTGVLSPVGTPPCLPCHNMFYLFIMMTSALSPLAAMRPLLSRTDLDQPALVSLRTSSFFLLLSGRRRALFARVRLKTTEFSMSSVSHVKHWFFLFFVPSFSKWAGLPGDEDVPTRRLVARPQRGVMTMFALIGFHTTALPRCDWAPHRRRLCVLGRPRAYDDHLVSVFLLGEAMNLQRFFALLAVLGGRC